MPIALPAQPCEDSVIFWSTELYQFADSFLRSPPLFPIAHADATTHPMIVLNCVVVLHGDAEVVHPSLKIGANFPVPVLHGDTPTAAWKTAEFGLETCKSLLSDSEPFAGEGETKKRTLLGLHHTAFFPVYLYLEFLLKEDTDTRHYTFSSASGLHQDDEVIGIPCEPMPPFLQFLIEIIQKDIAQKRRQWPALRHTFGRLVQPSVYDNTGPEVSAYQTKNAFVADSPGDPVHQNVVVDRIKELRKDDVHGVGISSLNKFQHVPYSLVRRSVGSEPKTGFGEVGIKDRRKNLGDRLLNHAIHDNGDAEVSGSTVIFWNLNSLYRTGFIRTIQKRGFDFHPDGLGIRGELPDSDTIDSRSPSICLDPFPCSAHVFSACRILHRDRIEGTVFHDAPHILGSSVRIHRLMRAHGIATLFSTFRPSFRLPGTTMPSADFCVLTRPVSMKGAIRLLMSCCLFRVSPCGDSYPSAADRYAGSLVNRIDPFRISLMNFLSRDAQISPDKNER